MRYPIALGASLLLSCLPGTLSMPADIDAEHAAAAEALRLVARAANPTAPWVSVDTTGHPVTFTPSATVITAASSTYTSYVSGAPYDVTGTVFTTTYYAVESTSTGDAAATATDASGAGAYAVCSNKDGDFKPFCAPSDNQTLYPGITYYVTWDSTYFPSNATVKVSGYFLNATTNVKTNTTAFSSGPIALGRSYYSWTVDSSAPGAMGTSASNVSIEITASWSIAPTSSSPSLSASNNTFTTSSTSSVSSTTTPAAAAQSTTLTGPRVLVSTVPTYSRGNSSAPAGKALYIGLPTVAAFVILMVCGTCIWNRKARSIGLGNIMSRRRFGPLGDRGGGGYGQRKSRMQRLGLGGRKTKGGVAAGGIRLMERDGGATAPGQRYRDEYDDREGDFAGEFGGRWEPIGKGEYRDKDHGTSSESGGLPSIEIPRRDSDALGSLVGTPTEERHMDFSRPNRGLANGGSALGGGSNVFRQEIERQNRERF